MIFVNYPDNQLFTDFMATTSLPCKCVYRYAPKQRFITMAWKYKIHKVLDHSVMQLAAQKYDDQKIIL